MSKLHMRMLLFTGVSILAVGTLPSIRKPVSADSKLPNLLPIPNSTGFLATFSDSPINLDNAFFQSLGTNGRSCGSCHQASDGWSVSAEHIRFRFYASLGTDPIFRPNDGSNCDTSDVSTFAAKKKAYSLLLNKGLIRVELPAPPGAEFAVTTVVTPYGCDSTQKISVYRRPLPTANLRFLATVMWDGRESHPGNTLQQNLLQQALDATTGHAQGKGLSAANQQSIVDFEMALFTAQLADFQAGRLDDDGAKGGPQNLSQQEFFIGINDPLGLNPKGTPFNPKAMTLFNAWTNAAGDGFRRREAEERKSIARGQALFNTRPISITGVAGLNDDLGVAVIPGTCTMNIGVADVALAANRDLPVFTLENLTTHKAVTTTDPGRALISGKWKDIGRTKGPILRGLSSRAPYFHNGSAATLLDAVNFYDTRFGIGFNAQEKADLVKFLSAL
ncbi:MAG: hypothetical protein NTW28_07510 [Candidatus Solibacter sp.]|nr:hypothetical protein [Candidatus Solibacter sp.]